MEIFLFVLIGWLAILWFSILRARLPLTINLFLFLCNSIFTTSISTLLGLNLQWVIPSQQPNLFLAHLIHRSMIDPILLLIFMNIYFGSRNALQRWFGTLAIFSLMVAIHVITEMMNIVEYGGHWGWYGDLLKVIMFMLVSFSLKKGFDKLEGSVAD